MPTETARQTKMKHNWENKTESENYYMASGETEAS